MAGLFSLIGGLGSVVGGLDIADDIRRTGASASSQMGKLAGELQGDAAFKGYGVQTGLGTSTVSPDGTTNIGVGPDMGMQGQAGSMMGGAAGLYGNAAQMAGQGGFNPAYAQAMAAMQGGMQGLGSQQAGAFGASQQAMGNAMQDTAGREQDIYNRAMAMQQPGLDQQRAQQQAREFAMGRSGIGGSQFGGTAEDAAMARAQAQAQNQASFQAMDQAQNEMMNQGALASQFGQLGQGAAGLQGNLGGAMGGLGQGQAQLAQGSSGLMANIAQGQGALGNTMYQNSFMPLQQQLNAMQVAQGNASMAQTGQLTGAGYGAQLGLGGVQTQVNADKAASEMYANLLGSGMEAIAGMGSAGEGFWDTISNLW